MKAKIISAESVYSGFLKVEKLQIAVPSFDGGADIHQTREIAAQTNSVFILPYDPNTNEVVLVAQHRPGAIYEETTLVYETIAGRVDKELSVEDIVVAEASEEAGLNVQKSDIVKLGEYMIAPGTSTEKAYVYLVPYDLSGVPFEAIHGLESEGENILMKKMHLTEAFDLSERGCSTSVILQMALLAAEKALQ
ncbi:NUDIX domain-containing protein [Vibrio owensii]|uniref:NUDIX domain-containing protein n=1 Tax=Vibrio harveyi group TaxID=717610 RepID=UPI003CC64025